MFDVFTLVELSCGKYAYANNLRTALSTIPVSHFFLHIFFSSYTEQQILYMLVSLKPGKHDRLYVKPRWPSRIVRIDSDVLNRLKGVSKKLPDSVNLVLTRGYESPSSAIGLFRNALRFFGRKIFLILYPSRLIEIDEIFSPNGHDTDGRHVDLEIMTQNRRVSLLPMGVFTSPKIIARQERHFEEIIQQVRDRIISVGGEFHTNRLEALQMHVDFAE